MDNVDRVRLAAKRRGVQQFPPKPYGAAISDNPKTEMWTIKEESAQHVHLLSEAEQVDPGEIVQRAIRSHFRLDKSAGESPIGLTTEPINIIVILDRDDELTYLVKAAAIAENLTHLAVLEQCISSYFGEA